MMEKIAEGLLKGKEMQWGSVGEEMDCSARGCSGCNLAPTEMRSSAHTASAHGKGTWCCARSFTETGVCWYLDQMYLLVQMDPPVSFGGSHPSKAPLNSR